MQKEILNFNELMAYTGLSKSYLYKLTHKRLIKFYKPTGKRIFFKKEDVDEFLMQNCMKVLNSTDILKDAQKSILSSKK